MTSGISLAFTCNLTKIRYLNGFECRFAQKEKYLPPVLAHAMVPDASDSSCAGDSNMYLAP